MTLRTSNSSAVLLPILLLLLGLLLPVGLVNAAPAVKTPPSPVSKTFSGTFLKTLSHATEADSDWRPLQDRFGRFQMAAPPSWAEGTCPADQQEMLYALVAFELQTRDGFNANLIVSQTQAAQGFVMKPAMANAIAEKMAVDMKAYHFEVKDKAFTTIDGIPCVIVGGTMAIDGRVLRNLQLRMVHRGLNYLFTFTALDKDYAQCEPMFARLTKSLAFEREAPAATPTPSPSPSPP